MKISPFLMVLVISLLSVSATSPVFDAIENTKTERVNITSQQEKLESIDFKIDNPKTKIEIKGLKTASEKLDKLNIIDVRQGKFKGSDIIDIKEAEIDSANIILEKYYPNANVSVQYRNLTTDDWVLYDGEYEQNSTHLWFNVTHFSEWTTTMPNIHIFNDIDDDPFFYVTDFATLSTGDIIRVRMDDDCTESSLYSDISYNSLDVDEFPMYMGTSACVDIFGVFADIDSKITFSSLSSNFYNKNLYNFIIIYDDFYTYQDTSGYVRITHWENFDQPTASNYLPPTVGETTATLRGIIDFNHLNNMFYYDLPEGFLDGRILYRETGASTWETTSWVSVSHNTVFSKSISGLTAGTEYEFKTQFDYYDPVAEGNVVIESSASTFTTESNEPFVETIGMTSSYKTDTTATIRGEADFNGVTDTFDGELCYKTSTGGTWDCDTQTDISEGIFTREISGLTADTEYSFYAVLEWDGGASVDTGSILTFTTDTEPILNTGLYEDLVSYYKLDETTGDVIDSHGSNDGTNYGATRGATGIINNAFDFDGTNDYISLSPSFSTSSLSFSFWMSNSDSSKVIVPFRIMSSTSRYNAGFRMYLNNQGDMQVTSFGDNDLVTTPLSGYISDSQVYDGNLNHYVVVMDFTNNEIEIYINGVSKTVTYVHQGHTGNTDFNQLSYIGAEADNTQRYLDGVIDEVGIWKRKLTSTEVSKLYKSGNALSYDNFVEPEYTTPEITTLNPLVAGANVYFKALPDWGNYSLASFEEDITYTSEFDASHRQYTQALYFIRDGVSADLTFTTGGTTYTETFPDSCLDRANEDKEVIVSIIHDTEKGSVFCTGGTSGDSSVTIINEDATLLSVPDDITLDITNSGNHTITGAFFNYRETNTTNWTRYPVEPSLFVPYDNEELTASQLTLDFETYYDVGAVINYKNVSNPTQILSLYAPYVEFQTEEPSYPVLQTNNASNIGTTVARFNAEILSPSDYEVEYYFRYRVNGSTTWNNVTNLSIDGENYYKDMTTLVNDRTYELEFIAYDVSEDLIISGGITYFDTLITGAPQITTLDATDIKRTEAQLNGEIVDIGLFSPIDVYFLYYPEDDTDNVNITDKIQYTEEVESLGIPIEGLLKNTSYIYYMYADFDGNNVSGGLNEFTTLSDADFIAPEMTDVFYNQTHNSVRLTVQLDYNDVAELQLWYYLYDSDTTLINTSSVYNLTGKLQYPYTFVNLEPETTYRLQGAMTYVNNGTTYLVETDYSTFTTLSNMDVPIEVCITDRFCLNVSDRAQFMMLLIVGATILGLGFAVGVNLTNGNGAEKILMTGVTGLVVFLTLWLYMVEIMPAWLFIYIILGNVFIGIYYVLQTIKGGSIYG